ncbi:MAG: prephenate dehydrogenase/arogenate dehydrogenase family protein [Chloroflexota bacterium]
MADAKKKITIVGLGLIGGSLGMALKSANLSGIEIVGHDRDIEVETRAQKLGAVDRREHNLMRAIEGASLIIIAVPITSMPDLFKEIGPDLAEGVVITDTASTKADVMRWANELLPSHVNFVGGHPMAGKETGGIENADGSLFKGKGYVITPPIDASPGAIQQVSGIATIVGAEPLFMDAPEHDQYAAAVSHLPLVISTALFTLLRASPSWEDMGMMASSGFTDITRLASTDPAMSHGIWRTNREAVIHWLERMIGELNRYRDLLKDAQDETLLQAFVEAQMQRDEFLRDPPKRRPIDTRPEIDARQTFTKMLVGGMVADNMKRVMALPDVMAKANAEREKAHGIEKAKSTFSDRVAEGVRRDLEKLRASREETPPSGEPEEPKDASG